MFSSSEKQRIIDSKSWKTLKWAIPFCCFLLLLGYGLSYFDISTRNPILSIIFSLGMITTFLLFFLIVVAIIGLLVDVVLVFLERK